MPNEMFLPAFAPLTLGRPKEVGPRYKEMLALIGLEWLASFHLIGRFRGRGKSVFTYTHVIYVPGGQGHRHCILLIMNNAYKKFFFLYIMMIMMGVINWLFPPGVEIIVLEGLAKRSTDQEFIDTVSIQIKL